MKFKKSIFGIIALLAFCILSQTVAFAGIASFRTNLNGSSNSTLCTSSKSTSSRYVRFNLDSGCQTLQMWAAIDDMTGLVLTTPVVVRGGDRDIEGTYKSLVWASVGTGLRGRAQHDSYSGTSTVSGVIDLK